MDVLKLLAASLDRKLNVYSKFLTGVVKVDSEGYKESAIKLLLKESRIFDRDGTEDVDRKIKQHLKTFGEIDSETYEQLGGLLRGALKHTSVRFLMFYGACYLAEVALLLRRQACAISDPAVMWKRTEFLAETLETILMMQFNELPEELRTAEFTNVFGDWVYGCCEHVRVCRITKGCRHTLPEFLKF